jgi:transketolase
MVGVAAGLAKAGFKPIVYGLAAFVPLRVLEQIKIDVCYEKLPVIFIGDGAGLVYSHLGTSHQSTEDIACTRVIPELTILSPADRFEMTGTMELALRLQSPVYLRIGKGDRGDVHSGPLHINAGDILAISPPGKQIAILATGSMVKTAQNLVTEGLDAEVWSVPSIKPIRYDQLRAIADRVDAIVTLEEHSVIGGLGACVAEELARYKQLPVCRIGIEDRFSTGCGTWEYLLSEHRLDRPKIIERLRTFGSIAPSIGKALHEIK